MSARVTLFRAFAAADASRPGPSGASGGWAVAPAAVLVLEHMTGDRLPDLLACGLPDEVERHEAAPGARRIDLSDAVLLPALVNAHTHLDLTHIGPRPFDASAGFGGWARMIISNRLADPEGLTESVQAGVRLSLAGGVAAIGDIAGVLRAEPARVLRSSGLLGVSFLEYFGIGAWQEDMAARAADLLERLDEPIDTARTPPRVRVGLQPHAPYTAGTRLLNWTARQRTQRGVPICIHLAETADEREFVSRGTGPFRAFLESMGFWDDSALDEIGKGRTPIEHLAPALEHAPWLVAHVNDCDDAGLEILSRTGTSVAYCPRSSYYFRNHESFGPHRYREMLNAGVNVCLGTDSIVNLPPEESDRISTLDEMRYLFRRDGTDPRTLLRMATTNGARALGLDPDLFLLGGRGKIGGLAGLIAVDLRATDPSQSPLQRALRATGRPELVLSPVSGSR